MAGNLDVRKLSANGGFIISAMKLSASTSIPWKIEGFPEVEGGSVFFGPDPDGLGAFEVATATAVTAPTRELLKGLLAKRKDKRSTDVVVALEVAGRVHVMGPDPDRAPLTLTLSAAQRQLQAALSEPDSLAAYRRFVTISDAHQSSEMPGVRNHGLFASYHLRETVRLRRDWEAACAESEKLTNLRHRELIEALGFSVSGSLSHGLLLAAGGESRALALLLEEDEGFDSKSNRFQVSPADWGLAAAASQDVPWVIVLRKEQLRLYASKDGVGVGNRGQSETFFELDLAVLEDDAIGLLSLIFSASALSERGTTDEILAESSRFASKLGGRLRARVYEQIVPRISTEVAHQLRTLGYELTQETLKLAYSMTLRILFRLLFQAYAEDRGLLPAGRNERYDANSLETFARRELNTSGEMFGTSASIWLDLVQVWDAIDEGNALWQVPAYNGGLFGSDEIRNFEGYLLKKIRLQDSVLGPALQALLIDENTEDGIRGVVDFRALSVREFGTIYEGLLESSLSLAEMDLELDANSKWVPASSKETLAVAEGEPYFHSASGERKASGSYFTPSFIVDQLVAEAIDGPLNSHIEKIRKLIKDGQSTQASKEFFDFRVADLAMGSGHFLVAAVDRIESKLRALLSEPDIEIPGVTSELERLLDSARTALGEDLGAIAEIEPASLLRRQIAKRCVYGIDINPIAVELARLSLWIHTFVPGLPMSSLDHGLVCANSLTGIGTIDEALDALLPNRKKNEVSLMDDLIFDSLSQAKTLLIDAANASESNKAEMANSYALSLAAKEASGPTKRIFETAVAARSGILSARSVLSQADFDTVASREDVQDLISRTNPGHMPYLFPEVFLRENGGFDCLIGNPPWEELTVEEPKFWNRVRPGLLGLSEAERGKIISELREKYPEKDAELKKEILDVEFQRKVLLGRGFPGMGTGDVDLYLAFAWLNWALLRVGGSAGLVFPRSLLTSAGAADWRKEVFQNSSSDVTVLVNNGKWLFADVTAQYTVALVQLTKSIGGSQLGLHGPFVSQDEFLKNDDAPTVIDFQTIARLSNMASLPSLPSSESFSIVKKMSKFSSLSDSENGFGYRPVREFDATNDKKYFMESELEKPGLLPVLGGSGFNIWQPFTSKVYAWANEEKASSALFDKRLNQAKLSSSAFFGLDGSIVSDSETLNYRRPRIVFRDIARATDFRTMISALVPPNVFLTNKAPYFFSRSSTPQSEAFLLGFLSTMVVDWYLKRFAELGMNYHLVNGTPIPWQGLQTIHGKRLIEVSGRLAAVDSRFQKWAENLGVPVGSVNSETEMEELTSELDALAACLYGLTETELEHIFDTFHRGWDSESRKKKAISYFRDWSRK
jgi:hypothetical protein